MSEEIKQLQTRIRNKIDSKANWSDNNPVLLKGEAAIISATYAADGTLLSDPAIKVGDGTSNINDLPYIKGILDEDLVEIIPNTPTQNTTTPLVYTGSPLTPVWDNFDSTKMTFEGVTSAINAGEYTARFNAVPGYAWKIGGSDESYTLATVKTVTWSIQKASQTITASDTYVKLSPAFNESCIYIQKLSTGNLEAMGLDSEAANTFSYEIVGECLKLTLKNYNYYSSIIKIKALGDSNYNDSSYITITVNCIQNFEQYTWKEISQISQRGDAAKYFNIGDSKPVKLSGRLGGQNYSPLDTSDLRVFIIGFEDHNDALERASNGGIHLCGFITSDGLKCALQDDCYNKSAYNATIGMSPNFYMSLDEDSFAGGWERSYLRKVLNGYEGVSESLMSILPTEFKEVLVKHKKYSDNPPGGTWVGEYTDETISLTEDYITVLSEYEYLGSVSLASDKEPNYQSQYKYFEANDGIFRLFTPGNYPVASHSGARIWLRSRVASSKNSYWKDDIEVEQHVISNANSTYPKRTSWYEPWYCLAIAPVFVV